MIILCTLQWLTNSSSEMFASCLLLVLLQMFSVGPKFKGMKMVPPGPHFVYYCSPNR